MTIAKCRVVESAQCRRVGLVGRRRRVCEKCGGNGRGYGTVAGHVGDSLAVERGWQGHVHDAEALLHGRHERAAGIVGWRAVGGFGEGGVDGGDHVVVVLVGRVVVGHGVRVGAVCLHGEQGAVHGELRRVGNVHAAKVAPGAGAVYDMAVGQDVGEGTLGAELAVALGEVLAGRALRHGLVRVQERAGLAGLACALAIELAGDVRGVCRGQPLSAPAAGAHATGDLLLLVGGLRGPAKPMSAMAPLERWERRSRELRRGPWAGFAGACSWWAKGPAARGRGGGSCWWW